MAQPTARGPVDIMGVTTRTNSSTNRTCNSEACKSHRRRIAVGVRYERVARIPGPVIESYHRSCFEDEFGKRELYGD